MLIFSSASDAVFYQQDSSVQCFDRAISNPLPKPDFKNFTYVGEAIIEYVPVFVTI